MAAITPSSINEAGVGAFRLLICNFTTVSVSDTWTSGIQGVVGYWGNGALQTTQASAGFNIVLTTASTGLFTFKPGEDAHAAIVYIVAAK